MQGKTRVGTQNSAKQVKTGAGMQNGAKTGENECGHAKRCKSDSRHAKRCENRRKQMLARKTMHAMQINDVLRFRWAYLEDLKPDLR